MKTVLAVLQVLCLSCAVCAETASVSVAKWRDNAKCAVSYTFDDGLADQYMLAFPVLKECGLRGTFWIVGSKIGDPKGFHSKVERNTPVMTWEMVKEMAAAGQEIASHGYAHGKLARMDDDAILKEVSENRRIIKEMAGVEALTFAYPYNNKTNKSGESIVELVESQGLIGSRRSQKPLGGSIDEAGANAIVERAKKRGEWLVFMTHGIARGYDHFKDPEQFFSHLRWVSKQKDVWVATFRKVCAYEKERNATTIAVETLADGSLRITPTVSALDKSLFTEKLTLIDRVGKVLAEFDPFAGPFTVKSANAAD